MQKIRVSLCAQRRSRILLLRANHHAGGTARIRQVVNSHRNGRVVIFVENWLGSESNGTLGEFHIVSRQAESDDGAISQNRFKLVDDVVERVAVLFDDENTGLLQSERSMLKGDGARARLWRC